MSENRAGRGEGLAGAIACVKEFIAWATEQIGTSEAHGCAEQAEDALKLLATPSCIVPPCSMPASCPEFGYCLAEKAGATQDPAGSGASDNAFLSELRDAVLLVPNMLNELGDLDDSGGEPEYADHPLKNIVSNVKAHCLGVCISIDEKLAGSPRKVGEDAGGKNE